MIYIGKNNKGKLTICNKAATFLFNFVSDVLHFELSLILCRISWSILNDLTYADSAALQALMWNYWVKLLEVLKFLKIFG